MGPLHPPYGTEGDPPASAQVRRVTGAPQADYSTTSASRSICSSEVVVGSKVSSVMPASSNASTAPRIASSDRSAPSAIRSA